MSRRDNGAFRCVRCRMLGGLCVCSLFPDPPLQTRTRLVLFIHRDEDRKTTNTGRLAGECIAGSEVRVRGHQHQPCPTFVAAPGTRPLLLFPHHDATTLERPPPSAAPFTLIVPDGTWRQARRVRSRVPGLGAVPSVALPAGERSIYHLRSESRQGGLATIEAIARAFELLEGPHVRATLERVFRAMVERTLWSRGKIDAAAITSGIPAGIERHDPRQGCTDRCLPHRRAEPGMDAGYARRVETEVQCPYCGESTTVTGDEAGGRSVEDCVVCCRPIDVMATVSEDGELSVTVRRQDE